jgi:hypothetical protein
VKVITGGKVILNSFWFPTRVTCIDMIAITKKYKDINYVKNT